VNCDNVQNLVRFISTFHRSRGSSEYRQLLNRIRETIFAWGIDEKDVKLLKYKTGDISYGNFDTTYVWEMRNAELWVDSPRRFINSFDLCRTSVVFGSGPTQGWETLELVDEHFEGDFSDKAVILNMAPDKAFDTYVKQKGAKCLILYHMRAQDKSIFRTPEKMPDTVNYLSFPYTAENVGFGACGFSVNWNQYLFLKEIANKGFKVRFFVESELITGDLDVLELSIPGSRSDMTIGIIAHLCHPSPGANDNASGSALAIELARCLAESKPPVNIKVILVPEFFGSIPYAKENHLDYVINLDMVGEDQAKTGSTLLLQRTPPILPTFLDVALWKSLKENIPKTSETPARRLSSIQMRGGSDHVVFANFSVPSPYIGQWPDRYYHTSDDTPDKCDPEMYTWIGNAILQSIFYFDSAFESIAKQAMFEAEQFLTQLKDSPGSEIISAVIRNAHGVKCRVPEPTKKITVNADGPLGYKWLKKKDISDKPHISDLGENIYLAARLLKDFDSVITFVSSYLKTDAKDVQDVMETLIELGYIIQLN